jgi:hypothetical protein
VLKLQAIATPDKPHTAFLQHSNAEPGKSQGAHWPRELLRAIPGREKQVYSDRSRQSGHINQDVNKATQPAVSPTTLNAPLLRRTVPSVASGHK